MLSKFKWAIISLIDYFKFLLFISKINNNEKLLIIVGHDGSSIGGASVVLNKLLLSLDTRNYKVVMLYKTGGSLLKKDRINGYYPFVYQYFSQLYINSLRRKKVQAFLVNTIICSNVIKQIQNKFACPIVWWLHEGEDLFKKMANKMPKDLSKNLTVLCVSSNTEKAFKKFYPNEKSCIFHYGIKDEFYNVKHLEKDKNKFVIGVVGMLCDRKNQLQIISLLKKIPVKLIKNVKINVIAGTWDNAYKHTFLKRAQKFKQINWIDGLDHKALLEEYTRMDLLLCCSKNDPLPVVVTEAMMMECPCLVSSGCGQYEYIENGVNGYKYDVNNTDEMVAQIVDAFNNKDIEKIKLNERKIYLKEFSMQQLVDRMSYYLLLR
ncbi:glycosyltransferase family 4 protein [Limosilactobacillus mucosae]|nr:glycosyltransferase family 4 protein [Limosilactobacillus mucosae]QOL70349.1 glycosyltransferase family 4 protein [Limosilactobacillus mucosae]